MSCSSVTTCYKGKQILGRNPSELIGPHKKATIISPQLKYFIQEQQELIKQMH